MSSTLNNGANGTAPRQNDPTSRETNSQDVAADPPAAAPTTRVYVRTGIRRTSANPADESAALADGVEEVEIPRQGDQEADEVPPVNGTVDGLRSPAQVAQPSQFVTMDDLRHVFGTVSRDLFQAISATNQRLDAMGHSAPPPRQQNEAPSQEVRRNDPLNCRLFNDPSSSTFRFPNQPVPSVLASGTQPQLGSPPREIRPHLPAPSWRKWTSGSKLWGPSSTEL
ncbi:PREDICTED: uncharacterized protein LOC104757309 [Camelina sativa]|uniref:Uncharacterized protein LOC104757309 n=1 Tax=Camelina sativa TaxID=90675 RepID=A0ABM0WZC3_CAMSA|nr:PREDICTED: uncharacterized protein LOC104757309 [Camelina sativa]XP_010478341.1 PREDICTED: uncharacterized protein LOC104757309 [Camelina sativa]